MATKTFGREKPSDVVVAKPDVSKVHAKVTFLGNDSFLVEDLDSTNGTFVNGYKIRKAKVTCLDEVRLSTGTILDLNKEFGVTKTGKLQDEDSLLFTEEFVSLRSIWKDYQTDKAKANREVQLKANIIRTVIVVGSAVLAYTVFSDLTHKFQGGGLIISSLGGLIGMAATSGMNANVKLQELYENFTIQYVCHKCQRHLGNFSWDYYKRVGKCPACNASFKKEQ